MADPRHPLTARVFVNRVWRWHFGRGIVGTTENFGANGRPPDPSLNCWTGSPGEFVKSGWSVKQLHRLIMNTSAYRMASAHPGAQTANAADPSNGLWWRFEIRRLEAEEIRDSILAVDRPVGPEHWAARPFPCATASSSSITPRRTTRSTTCCAAARSTCRSCATTFATSSSNSIFRIPTCRAGTVTRPWWLLRRC